MKMIKHQLYELLICTHKLPINCTHIDICTHGVIELIMERIDIRIERSDKEKWKSYAEKKGMTLTGLVHTAVENVKRFLLYTQRRLKKRLYTQVLH